jgi:poly-gamma-glutamate capsule biosynthesis protein CapA/YwtB (metallophosphatase superfamily)
LTWICNKNKYQKIFWLFLIVSLSLATIASGADSTETVSIVAAGDVMLGSWVQNVIFENGWDYPFRNIDSILTQADIVFANLEAPFGTKDSAAFEKTYTFQVAPDLVKVLTAGKINVVSVANNHILDFGVEDLFETMTLLNQNNIQYSGAGKNLLEARPPARMEAKGKKIAVACYSLTFPEEFWATDTTAGTCFPFDTFFYDDLRKFKAENDLVIVSFHWGGELLQYPKPYQLELAHNAIKVGADLVIGHHPHVVQGIELYRGKMIVYSLGNYIFGSYSESVKESMLLKFYFGTNGISACKIYPLNVYNKEVEFQPQLLTEQNKQTFLEGLNQISLELNNQRSIISHDGWVRF